MLAVGLLFFSGLAGFIGNLIGLIAGFIPRLLGLVPKVLKGALGLIKFVAHKPDMKIPIASALNLKNNIETNQIDKNIKSLKYHDQPGEWFKGPF